MNELVKNDPYTIIDSAKDKFSKILAEDDTGVDWEKESVFAYQAIIKNDYTLRAAMENKASLKMAMINVASVGLSLNPATSYAYLVPRGGAICLDISYLGLIKIATDSGSILWAKAELVYDTDEFIYKGPSQMPEHNANPFDRNRGEVVGVYCVAKTCDGDYLVETMAIDEVYKIRDEASKAAKNGPWKTYPGEMTKKVVIKRASKTWPKTQQHERIQKAVEVINETEGSEWAEETHRFKPGEKLQIIGNMRECLRRGDDVGVAQIVDEYDADPAQSSENEVKSMKFWALFNSTERRCINSLLNDNRVKEARSTTPELNEPIEPINGKLDR